MKLFHFVKSEAENEVDGTYELNSGKDVNIDREPEGWVTIYMNNADGSETYYLVLDPDSIGNLLTPTYLTQDMTKVFAKDNVPENISPADIRSARLIAALVEDWKKNKGCDDANCTTCKIGVALGLRPLDEIFNAAYRSAIESETAYPQQSQIYDIYNSFVDNNLLEDRREYSLEDYVKSYPFLSEKSCSELKALVDANFDPEIQQDFSSISGETLKVYFAEMIHNGFDGWENDQRATLLALLNDIKRWDSSSNKK